MGLNALVYVTKAIPKRSNTINRHFHCPELDPPTIDWLNVPNWIGKIGSFHGMSIENIHNEFEFIHSFIGNGNDSSSLHTIAQWNTFKKRDVIFKMASMGKVTFTLISTFWSDFILNMHYTLYTHAHRRTVAHEWHVCGNVQNVSILPMNTKNIKYIDTIPYSPSQLQQNNHKIT